MHPPAGVETRPMPSGSSSFAPRRHDPISSPPRDHGGHRTALLPPGRVTPSDRIGGRPRHPPLPRRHAGAVRATGVDPSLVVDWWRSRSSAAIPDAARHHCLELRPARRRRAGPLSGSVRLPQRLRPLRRRRRRRRTAPGRPCSISWPHSSPRVSCATRGRWGASRATACWRRSANSARSAWRRAGGKRRRGNATPSGRWPWPGMPVRKPEALSPPCGWRSWNATTQSARRAGLVSRAERRRPPRRTWPARSGRSGRSTPITRRAGGG